MRENSLMALALIGVIIGASGLGFGAYSTMQVQTGVADGKDGDDGDDGTDGVGGIDGIDGKDGIDAPTGEEVANIYYCSNQSEIEDALNTIGTGHGTLIITKNITLNSAINIDDGGHYIIQGAGPITLNRNASDETFSVTNVQSCTIKDLRIDASNITSDLISGIFVNEGNDNPIYIQKVQIGGSDEGIGILIDSENVWIENCILEDLRVGIYLDTAYCHILDNLIRGNNPISGFAYGLRANYSHYNIISGNVISDVQTTGEAHGIYIYTSEHNVLSSNTIDNITSDGAPVYGIWLYNSHENTLIGNKISKITNFAASFHSHGIVLHGSKYTQLIGNTVDTIIGINRDAHAIHLKYSDYTTITDNVIKNITSGGFGVAMGVNLYYSNYATITGNVIKNITSFNPAARGIHLYESNYNALSSNTVDSITSSISNANGIYLESSNYNALTGNVISNVQAGGNGYGIYLDNSDYNTVVGNTTYNVLTDNIYDGGTGNEVGYNIDV